MKTQQVFTIFSLQSHKCFCNVSLGFLFLRLGECRNNHVEKYKEGVAREEKISLYGDYQQNLCE